MVVIVVSGLPGAGKEEFVRVAVDKDFSIIRMGDVVRQHAMDLGLKMGDLSIGGHANSEREKHGKEIWAVRSMMELPNGNLIIDGCRSEYELAYFKKNIENMITVGIEASVETRFHRLVARKRDDDPTTMEDFQRREDRELGWGITDAVNNAQIKLGNDGSLEEFRQLCRTTLQAIDSGGY